MNPTPEDISLKQLEMLAKLDVENGKLEPKQGKQIVNAALLIKAVSPSGTLRDAVIVSMGNYQKEWPLLSTETIQNAKIALGLGRTSSQSTPST